MELILTEEGVLEDQTDLKYELDPDVRKADVYVETEARGLKSVSYTHLDVYKRQP